MGYGIVARYLACPPLQSSSDCVTTFAGASVAVVGYDRMIKFVGTLPLESVVDVKGVLVEANVKSCTQVSTMNVDRL